MEKLFKVAPEDNKKRLDKFLAENLSQYSRSYIQKLIEDGLVFVGGKIKTKKYILKESEKVKVFLKEQEIVDIEPDSSVNFEVIFENNDFLVINKPAGLVVHPSESNKNKTLVNGLLAMCPEIRGVGEDLFRPGIVHRLDKETSGLMVVAKTQKMFLHLKKEFKERRVEKVYVALVYGNIKKEKGEIIAKIGRVGDRQTTVFSGRGKKPIKKTRDAITKYKVKKHFNNFTLVDAIPKTGRMHQIRVHFLHIGHPIVGDKKYASKKLLKEFFINRQFLHASKLSFYTPSERKVEFLVSLPKDLNNILVGLDK